MAPRGVEPRTVHHIVAAYVDIDVVDTLLAALNQDEPARKEGGAG